MHSKELMDHLIRLHLEEGRTYRSLQEEFGVSSRSISRRVKKYLADAKSNEDQATILGTMEEIRKLREELAEVKKENDFLKKLAAFYAKETK